MTGTISSYLSHLELGDPTEFDNLAIVPLFHEQKNPPKYITLEEGLTESFLEVEELENGASVNEILIRNKSDAKALLFEGEELLGAMQNRILNVSVLVPGTSKQILPVSCVEAGRWHHRSSKRDGRRFQVADRVHYARGRALNNHAVSMNLDSGRSYAGNQSAVWEDIDKKSRRLDVESDTSASDSMYVETSSTSDQYLKSFKPLPSQIGSLFLVHGMVSGIEIFARAKTHKAMFKRLIRSYALDAIDHKKSDRGSERPNRDIKDQAKSFTQSLKNAWTKEFDGVGEGVNVRFRDDEITGGALLHRNRVLHLSALAV